MNLSWWLVIAIKYHAVRVMTCTEYVTVLCALLKIQIPHVRTVNEYVRMTIFNM